MLLHLIITESRPYPWHAFSRVKGGQKLVQRWLVVNGDSGIVCAEHNINWDIKRTVIPSKVPSVATGLVLCIVRCRIHEYSILHPNFAINLYQWSLNFTNLANPYTRLQDFSEAKIFATIYHITQLIHYDRILVHNMNCASTTVLKEQNHKNMSKHKSKRI